MKQSIQALTNATKQCKISIYLISSTSSDHCAMPTLHACKPDSCQYAITRNLLGSSLRQSWSALSLSLHIVIVVSDYHCSSPAPSMTSRRRVLSWAVSNRPSTSLCNRQTPRHQHRQAIDPHQRPCCHPRPAFISFLPSDD